MAVQAMGELGLGGLGVRSFFGGLGVRSFSVRTKKDLTPNSSKQNSKQSKQARGNTTSRRGRLLTQRRASTSRNLVMTRRGGREVLGDGDNAMPGRTDDML
jgi:hypothetical protein